MDSIGAQEAIIDITHCVVDFLSGCDSSPIAELNVWYHMLNCGFRLAMVGKTDYPCISDERPGAGRNYVRLEHLPEGDAGYEAWIRGLQQGQLYCGDGRSHFPDFKVNGMRNGQAHLQLDFTQTVTVEALIAACLEPADARLIPARRAATVVGWNLERARIGTTRTIPVELVVNGIVSNESVLIADCTPRSIRFDMTVSRSSWVALRILPSAHTHPVFIQIGGKPVRASRRSAAWCRAGVDKVWEVKSPFIRQRERSAAAAAFDHARAAYDRISAECDDS